MSINDKTVWVVERGSYSDYRVVGVFSSREYAQQIADAINISGDGYEKATIAEWPLDPAVHELRSGFVKYLVVMQEDGTVEKVKQRDIGSYEIAGAVAMWRRSRAPAYSGQNVKDVLEATVWAKDEAHAIKITNEHRTRMIASGEWYANNVNVKS